MKTKLFPPVPILLLSACIFLITSCRKNELQIGETTFGLSSATESKNIPYTDSTTLENLAANNSKIIPYQTARKMALIHLEIDLKASMNWYGTRLSDYPVLIYDTKSQPKYYEFIVKTEGGNPIGTITTLARKDADGLISHVLPWVRNYSNRVKTGSYQYITGAYPTRLYLGIPAQVGIAPTGMLDAETEQVAKHIVSEIPEEIAQTIRTYTSEQLSAMGYTSAEEIISQMQEKEASNKQYAESFWVAMDSLKEEFKTMPDASITQQLNQSKDEWYTYNEYLIPEWTTTAMQNTRWRGWCAPSALSWIYRGIYTQYKGGNLLLTGDQGFASSPFRVAPHGTNKGYYNFDDGGDNDNDRRVNDLDKNWVDNQSATADNDLYARIAEMGLLYAYEDAHDVFNSPRSLDQQNGPVVPFLLGPALADVTQTQKTVGGTSGVTNARLLGAYSVGGPFGWLDNAPAHEYIRNTKLPVICLVNSYSHYIVAVGSKYETYHWATVVRIFKRRVTVASGSWRSNKWLLVHDNGATTAGNTSNPHGPYWKNDSYTADLQYPIIKIN